MQFISRGTYHSPVPAIDVGVKIPSGKLTLSLDRDGSRRSLEPGSSLDAALIAPRKSANFALGVVALIFYTRSTAGS